jgi:hypothetical protein
MASQSLVPDLKGIKNIPLSPPPILKKLDEMDDSRWAAYQKSAVKWYTVFASKEKANFAGVNYLYHATGADNVGAIQKGGLCPRDPSWKTYKKTEKVPRFDASKDGYLSMAITTAGAGAMGGKSVLLRMAVGADINQWDFRVYSATEVRTLMAIPADRLELSKDWKTWGALSNG